jgi:hypothetical protein
MLDGDGSFQGHEYQVPMEAQLPLTGNRHITYKIERDDEEVGQRLLKELQNYKDPHFLHKTETTWDFIVLTPTKKSFTFLVIDPTGVTVVIPGDLGSLHPVARLPSLGPNDTTIASLLKKEQTKYYQLSYGAMQSACARMNTEYKIEGENLFARAMSAITTETILDFDTTQTCEDPNYKVENIGDDEVTVECNDKIVASYPSNIPATTEYCIALQETLGYNPWWLSSYAGHYYKPPRRVLKAGRARGKGPDPEPTAAKQ